VIAEVVNDENGGRVLKKTLRLVLLGRPARR
jgi:hypothetical protein